MNQKISYDNDTDEQSNIDSLHKDKRSGLMPQTLKGLWYILPCFLFVFVGWVSGVNTSNESISQINQSIEEKPVIKYLSFILPDSSGEQLSPQMSRLATYVTKTNVENKQQIVNAIDAAFSELAEEFDLSCN